jgi:hypothetical protein
MTAAIAGSLVEVGIGRALVVRAGRETVDRAAIGSEVGWGGHMVRPYGKGLSMARYQVVSCSYRE